MKATDIKPGVRIRTLVEDKGEVPIPVGHVGTIGTGGGRGWVVEWDGPGGAMSLMSVPELVANVEMVIDQEAVPFRRRFACPQCGDTEQIDIVATVWVRLIQDSPDNIETDSDATEDGSHEWDSNSEAKCGACGRVGIVEDFDGEESKVTTPVEALHE